MLFRTYDENENDVIIDTDDISLAVACEDGAHITLKTGHQVIIVDSVEVIWSKL